MRFVYMTGFIGKNPLAVIRFLVFGIFLFASLPVWAKTNPQIHYQIEFVPKSKSARITIQLDDAKWLERARFNTQGYEIKDLSATGKFSQKKHQLYWHPPETGEAKLQYSVSIPRQRPSGGYDAYITDTWALLRGERLVPPVAVIKRNQDKPEARVTFKLPKTWTSVNTGWQYTQNPLEFNIPKRTPSFSRPAGWMIAGNLGTRKDQMLNTFVIVSAPKEQDFRQMQMSAFLSMMWPHIDQLFPKMPEQLLIAGAKDPMWRGGLSSPTSLYVHAERPLVGENGTSTLIHELIHVFSGIHGKKGYDWIAEGIAEYYSVELLFRSGAYTQMRRDKVFNSLHLKGAKIKSLKTTKSSGEITARAAVYLRDLDAEMRTNSASRYNLDHLLKRLLPLKTVDLKDLQREYKKLIGKESQLLFSPLVM
jgi:hypothetical protein